MSYDFIFLVCVAAILTTGFAVVVAAAGLCVDRIRERRTRRSRHARRATHVKNGADR